MLLQDDQLMMQMSYATTFFEPRMETEMWSLASSLSVKTFSKCISSGPTVSLGYDIIVFFLRLVMGGGSSRSYSGVAFM